MRNLNSFLQQLTINQRMINKISQPVWHDELNVCNVEPVNQLRASQANQGEAYQHKSENKIGHWSLRQNAKYYAFLKKFNGKFSQRESRRQCKVFKALAEFIKTRNANQCRSHHHKMQKNFNTVQQNLQQLLKKNPSLQEKCQKYFSKLQLIQKSIFGEENQQRSQKIISHQNCQDNLGSNKAYLFGNSGHESMDNKKNQIEVMRTAASYQNEQNIEQDQINFESAPKQKQDYGLNRLFFINKQSNSVDKTESLNVERQQLEIPKFSNKSCNNKYLSKLIQCQEYFAKWYSKVTEVIKKEEQQIRMLNYKNWLNHQYPTFYY